MLKIWRMLVGALMLHALVMPVTSNAQDLDDRFWLNVAAFRLAVNSTVQVVTADDPDQAAKIDF